MAFELRGLVATATYISLSLECNKVLIINMTYVPCAPRRWFWREGSLEKLSKDHLIRLLKACNTVPPFKKMAARFAPKLLLVAWLRNEASSIRCAAAPLTRK